MLEFIENGHVYKYNGEAVPSVSEILRPLGGDPLGDDDYYLELAMDAAAERGIVLHDALQTLLGGGEPEEIPEAYEAHMDAVRLFASEHDITPYMMETPLYEGNMGFAGTPDLVACFDGIDAILDYKFVAQVNKPRVKAQLNAYKLLCEANNIEVDALYAVQFMSNGRYRLYPVAVDESGFALCWGIYHELHKKQPRGAIA